MIGSSPVYTQSISQDVINLLSLIHSGVISWLSVVATVSGPGVRGLHVGVCAEDWLALVRQVGDVGELMAVELENSSQSLLFVPLAAEAGGNIVDILVEHVDL